MDIVCVLGTRPEAIKIAPVVQELRKRGIRTGVLATAQHRHLLDQMLLEFKIAPDWDLDAMKPMQTLPDLTGFMVPEVSRILGEAKPKVVLAQGDTATVFCAALASFYSRIPFGHVEAGLRSGDLAAPFPEEAMRRLTSVVSQWHFAPSDRAAEALRKEGVEARRIHVVGNTVIDALKITAARPDLPWPSGVPQPPPGARTVLITLHRRENFGVPIERILTALRAFATENPDGFFIYPVHPNPNVLEPARRILGDVPNVHLASPFEYPEMVRVMNDSYLLLTDSGGLQEEGPAMGKPVLVFRDTTERPEAEECGSVKLVGSDREAFLHAARSLWNDVEAYRAMAVPRFPYGSGDASQKIVDALVGDAAFAD